jgi:hypothetical protein
MGLSPGEGTLGRAMLSEDCVAMTSKSQVTTKNHVTTKLFHFHSTFNSDNRLRAFCNVDFCGRGSNLDGIENQIMSRSFLQA